MRAFTAAELGRMQGAQEDAMQDTCVPLIYTEIGTDTHGKPTFGYVASAAIACGYDPGTTREMLNGEAQIVKPRLRLPIDEVISGWDRVRLTHRFGVAMAPALDFELDGTPRRGPSGLVVDLRQVV